MWCSDIISHLFGYLADWKKTIMSLNTVDFIFIFKMAFYFVKYPTLHIFLFFVVFNGIWWFLRRMIRNSNSGKGIEFFQVLLLLLYRDSDTYPINRPLWTYPIKILVVCMKQLRNYLIWEICQGGTLEVYKSYI